MLFDFDYLVGNSNFITDIFVVYETNPESLAYGRPIGGFLRIGHTLVRFSLLV